jgi:thiamine pyrophosphokinase
MSSLSSGAPDVPAALRFDAVVLAGGDELPPSLLPALHRAIASAPLVVAADGGIAHAHRVDRDPDVLVGDLDSITPEALARATTCGTRILRHPVDKDATDLGLALDLVLAEAGARGDEDAPALIDTLVVGGHGGRADHLLGNAMLLAAARYEPLRLTAWWGRDVLHVVRTALELSGEVGDTVSLLAVHGAAHGVTTEGLTFPLEGALLEPGSSLGISNTLTSPLARIDLAGGVLLVIRPDADA